MRSHVDIVLIGDRDVGKTTLITSAQTGKYEPNVPPLLEVIPLPPETLREPVAVSVTDTSLRCQEEGDIVEAVKAADAICIVFAADDEESMIRVSTYWMPLITDALPPDAPTPVLMIGNKVHMWTILWAFGYDDDLSLNEEYMCPTLELEKDSVPEISPIGMEFLIRLFRQYDVDGSGLLSQEQLERVFEVCPAVPWADDVYPASDELEWTLEQFISLWVYLCWSDPSAFMRTLAYLGFNFRTPTNTHGSVKDAIRPSRARREERRVGKSTRTVHVLFIFGKQQAGKLREFAVNGDDHEVISSSYCADKCDVAALCFDVTDPSSFAHAADLQAAVVRPGPRCVMLACKADEVAVEQQFPLQPPEYSRQHNIPLVQVSSQRGDTDDAFAALVDQASKPRESDGGLGSGISSRSLSWLRTAGAIAAAAVAAYFAFRYDPVHT
ncbi:hypothetical protein PTSG_07615 [Salpingoeca rosetta]|uniref:EF-hand domain-containing protein n=1 Tax=Salpingoeca rosetta (strain ATCC 50818 / BSB-021) TaxID=946362 RepID=F2UH99_SALR5|nr:uncharacterized protein PTSG_07615 [Salpingoeca rosetta]EGD76498.1 hypothetical protein PTSG_07615 [Salpingoeca rosetta]|eukprot:XP_004991412.1 hypothetical protein PTSG_07615 [Salpingoeca rosetta]